MDIWKRELKKNTIKKAIYFPIMYHFYFVYPVIESFQVLPMLPSNVTKDWRAGKDNHRRTTKHNGS